MNYLLVLTENIEKYKNELNKYSFSDLNIYFSENSKSAKEFLNYANIILGNPYYVSQILENTTNLQWVQSTFAGNDSLCNPKLRKDYILTGVKEIFGPLMSEYVMSYILCIERNLFEMRKNQNKKIWNPISYRKLSDLKAGIAGFGSIGKHIARTISGFGIQVCALKRTTDNALSEIRIFTNDNVKNFLKELDYLIITLPSTPETENFINNKTLSMLKPSCTIINIGRGSVIDECALIYALKNNLIRGAVLDVFNKEPLDKKSPLWNMDNVIITPHISAVSFSDQIVKIFHENYLRFMNNEDLNYQISFDKGY